MAFQRKINTRRLSEGAYQLSVKRQYRWLGILAATVLLLTAAGFGVLQYYHLQYAPASRITELKQENDNLRLIIARMEIAQKLDNSVDSSCERDVVNSLVEEVRELKSKLKFYEAQNTQPQ